MKLIWLIALGCIAWKLFTGRWPWHYWLAAKKREKPGFAQIHAEAQARALLGLAEGASREAILDAHRKRVIQVHPDRGGSSEKVHEANAARDLLLGKLDQSGPS
jgi:hypothetical protein